MGVGSPETGWSSRKCGVHSAKVRKGDGDGDGEGNEVAGLLIFGGDFGHWFVRIRHFPPSSRHFGGQVGKELNLISENFIFCSTFLSDRK